MRSVGGLCDEVDEWRGDDGGGGPVVAVLLSVSTSHECRLLQTAQLILVFSQSQKWTVWEKISPSYKSQFTRLNVGCSLCIKKIKNDVGSTLVKPTLSQINQTTQEVKMNAI